MKKWLILAALLLVGCGVDDTAPPKTFDHIKHLQVNDTLGSDFTFWRPDGNGYATTRIFCPFGTRGVRFYTDVAENADDWIVVSKPDTDYDGYAYAQIDVHLHTLPDLNGGAWEDKHGSHKINSVE